MAKPLGSSFKQTSDMVYDYVCSPCEENNLNAEASFYCHKCSKQLCVTCEELHRRLNKSHPVLGRAKISEWGTVRKETLTEMCEIHKSKELEMYCGDHDEVICTICVSVVHRSCKVVKHLPEVAVGIRKTPEFKDLPSKVGKTTTKLNQMADDREKNRTALKKSCNEIVASIHDIKKKINKRLDKLEKDTVDKMNKILAKFDGNIQDDIDQCTRIQEDLKKLLQDIQGAEDESFSYIGYKKCRNNLTKAEQMLGDMTKPDYEITFRINNDMEKYLSSGSFGHIGKSSEVKPDHVYMKQSTKKFSNRMSSDTSQCSITGCCLLPNGHLVLVDWRNQKVTLFDEHRNVKSDCSFNDYPCDVCHIADNKVAVACVKYIQFIDASCGHLKLERKMDVDKQAIAIAYNNGQLYVGGDDGFYTYTTDGQMISKLYDDKIWRFSISNADGKIYLTTGDKHLLITLDSNGKQIAKLSDVGLDFSTGICVAGNGSVFVCGRNSNNIVQVDQEGKKKLSNVAGKSDGLTKPLALCFNTTTSELIVGQEDDDNILVLQMK